jgi:hypothetical protein
VTLNAAPGDLLFLWGTTWVGKAIEWWTGGPSHSAILIDPSTVTDQGGGLGGPYLAESTITGPIFGKHIDGVQVSSLPIVLAGYDGSIALCRLAPRVRTMLRFDRMWELLYAKVNRDRYEKLELLEYVARAIPLVNDIPQWDQQHREVCSELVTQLLAAGGLPDLDPFCTTPQRLIQMQIYGSLEWLKGPARRVKGFNSR